MYSLFSHSQALPKSNLSRNVMPNANGDKPVIANPLQNKSEPNANELNHFGHVFTPIAPPAEALAPARDKAEKPVEKSPLLKPSTENLPLLLQDGKKNVDKTEVYKEQNYSWLYHETGQGICKTIGILKSFLSPSDNEKGSDKNSLAPEEEKKSKKTNNPYRALLEKNGFDLKKLDAILTNDELLFRNSDYGLSQLQNMNELTKALKKITEDKKSFEEFVKNAPEDMQKFIKEPLESYLTLSPKAVETAIDGYKKIISHKNMPFLERVLYDKYLNGNLETGLKNLSALDVVKTDDYLKHHVQGVSQAVNEFLKVSKALISHCEGDAFNQDEMMKHVSQMPELLKDITYSLANAFGDEHVRNNPAFSEKLGSILETVHAVIEGPLGKDIEYWLNMQAQIQGVKNIQDSVPQVVGQSTPVPSPSLQKEVLTTDRIAGLPQMPSPTPNQQEILPFMGTNTVPPQALLHPLQQHEQFRPPIFDDSFPRRLQNYNEWSIYGRRLAERVKAMNEVADTVQDIALTPSGRPDPEFIALTKRHKQLEWLKKLMHEATEANKATQAVEQETLKSREEYVKGTAQLMQEKMKLDTDEALQRANMNLLGVKGATTLAAKNMEASLAISESRNKMFNLFMEKTKHIYNNTWSRIKSIADGFKWR